MSIAARNKKILSYPTREATCVLKKLPRVNTHKGISQRLLHYVDEESKYPSQVKQYKSKSENAIELIPSEDFVEHPRSVFARGFFVKEIQAKTGKSPHLLDPKSMLKAVDDIWLERIAVDSKRKPKSRDASMMHNGVLAISPKFGRLITESGRDVDKFLVQVTHNVMRKWQKHFLEQHNKKTKGKKLKEEDVKFAYIVGVHHDREHMHAHFCLYPYTEQGNYIKWSDNHRTKDYVFTWLRKEAGKEAFAYFRDEMYAPAYLASIGQDLRWQTHIVLAKARSDSLSPSNLKRKSVSDRIEEIGHMQPEEYQNTLSESYDWAKKKWEKFKERKITPEEVAAEHKVMKEIFSQAGKSGEIVALNRHTIRQLELKKKALAESLKRKKRPRYGIIDLNLLEYSCDFWMLLLGYSFKSSGSDPKIDAIFKSLVGKSPKFSFYMMLRDLFRDMYAKSSPPERRLLKEIVHYSCKFGASSAAEALLKKKVISEIEGINSQIKNRQEMLFGEVEKIKEMHCKYSELVLDAYFKGCILKNKKPVIFRPEIESEMKLRRAKMPGKTESIFACVRRMKASMKDVSYTPDMAFEGAIKRLTLEEARQRSPNNEALR